MAHVKGRSGAQAVMMLGLSYDHADFIIREARKRGVGPSAVAREILDAEIRRRHRRNQGTAKLCRIGTQPVVASR